MFEAKHGDAHCECCCEFHTRPSAALPQTIKPQISGVSCTGCKKRLRFHVLQAHWCYFSVPLVATRSTSGFMGELQTQLTCT